MTRSTLLIPVVFPDPPLSTDMYVEGLAGFDVILFGYWETPASTTPEAARAAHETEAEAVLYETAARLSRAGASTDVQLHFGPGGDEKEAIQHRIAEEADADGVLISTHLSAVHNVIIPLRDDRKRTEVVDFVSAFDPETTFVLELFHVAPEEGAVGEAERMLARVERTLLDRGFSESDLELTVEVGQDPVTEIVERARNHNLVVMGETAEMDTSHRFLGPVHRDIVDRVETPVVVLLE